VGVRFHLFEPMDDCGMELVFVGKMPFEVGLNVECLGAKGATMMLRESAEELVIVEVAGYSGGELTVVATEGW
jgi:hypothetical protein